MNLFTTKGNMMLTTRAYRFLAAGLILLSSAAAAQTSNPNTTDAALIERVKEAVIKELRESGALDREIDAGIDLAIERTALAQLFDHCFFYALNERCISRIRVAGLGSRRGAQQDQTGRKKSICSCG